MTTANTAPLSFTNEFHPGNVKSAMSAVGASSGDLWRVPVESIKAMPGLNVRVHDAAYEAHIAWITASIMAEGYYQDKPLGVFIADDGAIFVRDGHSRLEAVQRAIAQGAQIKTLPCVPAPKGTTMEDIIVGLVKSNTGKPLNPIEIAVVCKRMQGWGQEQKVIAERLGMTSAYVGELLGLLAAPEEVQKLVKAGKVSATLVMEQIKAKGSKEASKVITEAAKGNGGARVTLKTLKLAAAPKDAGGLAAPKKADPAIVAQAKAITQAKMMGLLQLVFDDKAFSKLADKTQQAVLAALNP